MKRSSNHCNGWQFFQLGNKLRLDLGNENNELHRYTEDNRKIKIERKTRYKNDFKTVGIFS